MKRLLAALAAFDLVLAVAAGCKASGTVDCPGLPTAAPTATTSGTCTWTYVPDTSTTTPPTITTTSSVPTTTTTTPPTTTTTSSTPPPNGFPTPTTTGAPAGLAFSLHAGDVTINTAGQVINGWHVTGDLVVNAPGVVIKNSVVDGMIENDSVPYGSTRMQVSDTTVGLPTGCQDNMGVGEHDYTATRVLIRGRGHGFQVSGNNVTVTDSFVQTCNSVNQHDDGFQIYCPAQYLPQPCGNIVFNHNTLSVANTQNFTAPMFGGSDPGGPNGQIANSSFTNNLLWGGVYSIYTEGKSLTITGNRLATNRWVMPNGEACEANTTGVSTPQGCAYAGWVYRPVQATMAGTTCAQQNITWSDNQAVAMDSNWQPTGPGTQLPCA